jgi:hypothetical protein
MKEDISLRDGSQKTLLPGVERSIVIFFPQGIGSSTGIGSLIQYSIRNPKVNSENGKFYLDRASHRIPKTFYDKVRVYQFGSPGSDRSGSNSPQPEGSMVGSIVVFEI